MLPAYRASPAPSPPHPFHRSNTNSLPSPKVRSVPLAGGAVHDQPGRMPALLPAVDLRRTAPQVPDRPAADVHQDHQRGAGGRARGPQGLVQLDQPRHARRRLAAAVARHALRALLHAHRRAGAAQVRAAWLQCALRVQPVRPLGVRDLHAEPPQRHGDEEAAGRLDCHQLHGVHGAVRRAHHRRLGPAALQHLRQGVAHAAVPRSHLRVPRGLHRARQQADVPGYRDRRLPQVRQGPAPGSFRSSRAPLTSDGPIDYGLPCLLCTGTSRTCPWWTTPRSSGCTATPTSPTAPHRPRPCLGPSWTSSPRRAAAAAG